MVAKASLIPTVSVGKAQHAPGKPSEQVGNQKPTSSVGNITERNHTSSVGNITIHTSSVGNITERNHTFSVGNKCCASNYLGRSEK